MPYVIYNPWDRLPPQGRQGIFRRWTNLSASFARRLTATAPVTSVTRTVVLRYELAMFFTTGYAGGSSKVIGPTTALTEIGRYRDYSGLNALPSGGAVTGDEELLAQTWLARPTGTFPAYAQTLFTRSATQTFRLTGASSGATAAVSFSGVSVQPYLHSQSSPARMVETLSGATSLQLSGYIDDLFTVGYMGFYRMTWQGGPSRYPYAAGADVSPAVTRFPSGFLDGETVILT